MSTFINALKKEVGETALELYSAPTGMKSIFIELDVCNVTPNSTTLTATNAAVSVILKSSGIDYYITKNAVVPVGSSLQVVAGQKIVLQSGDAIYVKSSVPASLDCIASILEDVN